MQGRIASLVGEHWKKAAVGSGIAAGGLATGLLLGGNTRDAQPEPQQLDDQVLAQVQMNQVAEYAAAPQSQMQMAPEPQTEYIPGLENLSEEDQLKHRLKLVKERNRLEDEMALVQAQQQMYGVS